MKDKDILNINAARDDCNLAEHGLDSHYWYSVEDGIRLLMWLRKEYLNYEISSKLGEEYSPLRKNKEKTLITDPYYLGNFCNYLKDDISRITPKDDANNHTPAAGTNITRVAS